MWRLTKTENSILLLIILVFIAGFTLFYTERPAFVWFVQEDSLVEWLTVAGLLMASVVCFYRFIKLFRKKSWWFLTVNFVLGLLLFFAAGEEISWGQRILGIESSEFFQENNLQKETNLHNLVVDGVKINRLVFTSILGVALALFLVLLPVLFYRNQAFKRFINNSGIIVPRLYQVIGFILVAGLSSLIPHDKNPELLECGASLLFFLIVLYPGNKPCFNSD